MSSNISSDSSSLVDLKAEVFRKRQEAKTNRLRGVTASESKGAKKKYKMNVGVELRAANDKAKEEEEVERKNVRDCLEKKALLYERLQAGHEEELKDRFLVDFDEEEIEYTDSFGRTRTCRPSDLKRLEEQDRDLRVSKMETTRVPEENDDLLSEDMRRELLRRKWTEEEEQNLRKKDIHYGDILFDEARNHGAGFYRFSRDERARVEEKAELDKLHKETTEAKLASQKRKAKRESIMAERLKKVKDKKRLKMGLPIKATEVGEVVKEDIPEDKGDDLEKTVLEGLKEMRERDAEQKRKAFVREWDVGKERVVMTQDEWVDKKRVERIKEFAPPNFQY